MVAETIAHELGHSLGMREDRKNCKCIDEQCIMSVWRSSNATNAKTHWSDCSIHQLNTATRKGIHHCLQLVPKKLFESPTCGNGFVETSEECDCGLPAACKNVHCDPQTCKFQTNM